MLVGYGVKLSSRSFEMSEYRYNGEWISNVIPISGDALCVSLNLSVPVTFHVAVDLVTNTGTQTVYTVDNAAGETEPTDILTVFEVQLDAAQTHCQLVVRVSQGTEIRNADIKDDQCSNSGAFLVLYTLTNGWTDGRRDATSVTVFLLTLSRGFYISECHGAVHYLSAILSVFVVKVTMIRPMCCC